MPLNRIVQIQERNVVRDGLGGEVVTWAPVVKLWAEVTQTGVSKDFENDANRDVALRNAQVRILWRGDIDETQRMVYDGLPWDIKGIGEVGFRKDLMLTVQTDVHNQPTHFLDFAPFSSAFGPGFEQ